MKTPRGTARAKRRENIAAFHAKQVEKREAANAASSNKLDYSLPGDAADLGVPEYLTVAWRSV